MKKLLLISLMSLVPVAITSAETTQELAKRLTDFISMEQNHKAKWSDFNKEKTNLINKHHKQFSDLEIRKLNELGKTKDINTYLSSKLEDMIELHEKHLAEWKALHEKSNAFLQSEISQLNKFRLKATE